jgi:putative hemolysin
MTPTSSTPVLRAPAGARHRSPRRTAGEVVGTYRVFTPEAARRAGGYDRELEVPTPTLIKGYLRCGDRLLGAPAWDPDFGAAELPLLVRTADLPASYRRAPVGN